MSVTIANAESAWLQAQANVTKWEAKVLTDWYMPMVKAAVAMSIAAMPPEVLAKLDIEQVMKFMEGG